MIGIDAEDAPLISAKTGLNVHEVLEQIVQQIPSPVGDPDAPLQALIFDSKYDSYKGSYCILPYQGRHCQKRYTDADDGDGCES